MFCFVCYVLIRRDHPLLNLSHPTLNVNRLSAKASRKRHSVVAHSLQESTLGIVRTLGGNGGGADERACAPLLALFHNAADPFEVSAPVRLVGPKAPTNIVYSIGNR